MDYKERKNQLNNAVVEFLKKNNLVEYDFPPKSEFNAKHYGTIHRETLDALLLTDTDEVEVITHYNEVFGKKVFVQGEHSTLTEFSNDEIVSIMEVAGIDIPAKKVEENPENPCIIGIFVVSL